MGAVFGRNIKISIFGESHGAGIGCVLSGLPAGIELDLAAINLQLQRRAPGNNPLATARREADMPEIISGVFNGRTTGAPLCMLIKNSQQHSKDYSLLKDIMRPGHADYSAYVKYNGFNDYRGGGHFSGRLTAPLVFAGAIASQILAERGIMIGAHIKSIAHTGDRELAPSDFSASKLAELRQQYLPTLDSKKNEKMQENILRAKENGDSVGGVIEAFVLGVPAGIGENFFDSLESQLAAMLFSIPAVKGVEFGAGYAITKMLGSKANDEPYYENEQVKFGTNHNGGIIGGITTGAPLVFSVAVKPTPSIYRRQNTIDVDKKQNTQLCIVGRHDPCIVPRAVPVVEAAAAWVILDNLIQKGNSL